MSEAAGTFSTVLLIGVKTLFALGHTQDLSNRLIFLFIFAVFGSAKVSLYVSVHFDQLGVGVRGTLVSQHSLLKFPNISILRLL